jgi:hypothetical protein
VSLLLLLIGTLWASVPEQEFSRALARARSATDVERLQADYDHFKIADSACRVELREHSAPVNCYEALALEKPAPVLAVKASRLKRLDRLCALAAASLHFSEPSTFVSAVCAKNLASARDIQKYREDEGADWSGY